MSKWVLLLCGLCCLSFKALAEEDFADSPAAVPVLLSLPECNDAKLKDLVREKIVSHFASTNRRSLVDQRRQKLLLRNLEQFKEISVASFPRKENYWVADNILMTKINDGLKDEDLRLCRSSFSGRIAPIYLLLHPENYQRVVDIINFVPQSGKGKDFFIIYE